MPSVRHLAFAMTARGAARNSRSTASRPAAGMAPFTWQAVKPGEMVADAFGAVAREGCGAGDGTVEGEDFADAVLFDGGPERELDGDMARVDGIAMHDEFAVAEDVRIHHLRSDHGDVVRQAVPASCSRKRVSQSAEHPT